MNLNAVLRLQFLIALVSSDRFQPELQQAGAKVTPNLENNTCPLWRNGSSCECGNDLSHIVQCNGKHLSLKTCYCMTEQYEELMVSYCLYTCGIDVHYEFSKIRTTNITQLNDDVCKLYSRTGLMCGKCIKDHAPAVYSYSLACANCTDSILCCGDPV